ncbi:hypothetical protein [Fluviicola taffensis]|uniref:Uncharacterized protein n=1 Tax=Fluviicola taffensis (strain DSM 16823 / NCIMB 13979 / RW262) TaxID=755732 RepID=F2IGE0_FLUTR|nr:hypothetical protein [Fluviicola taffensis]AEA45806.1 hypothetical protein Fluta_3840 [Fluviicola taffensis DSM 16823]
MKIIRKLSVRLILFQVLAIHLFGIAFSRFYYFLDADLYECLLKNQFESVSNCMEHFSNRTIGEMMATPIHYMLYGFLFGIILISIVNGISKKTFLNTVLVAALFILLFLIGVFSNGYLDLWINSLARLFSKKIDMSNLMASLIAFSTGLLLVWVSVKNKLLSKTETAHV